MADIFRPGLIEIVMLSDRNPPAENAENLVRLLPRHTLDPFLDILVLRAHVRIKQ